MKIVFVRPNMIMARSTDAMQPLVFAILAALTPSRHQCRLYDERLEDIPLDEEADLVAMTVEAHTARRAYAIAAAYRARGVPVVMGGFHPTLATEEVAQHADSVVLGDAETTWPRLLEDLERGELQQVYRDDGNAAPAGLLPDRSVFDGKPYMPLALVQFQRGCRYACDFCSIRAFYGERLRIRPVADVLAEIDALQTRSVFFVDDNFFGDREAARELMTQLCRRDIRWGAQISIDVTDREEDVELLRRSGCFAVLIGFESFSPENLRQMRKGWNLRGADYRERVRRLQRQGIMLYGTFVFGYDQDRATSFDTAVDFALDCGLFLANFNPLTPTPGTPLYERLKAERRLIHDPWWLSDDWRYGQACFEPRGMSARELEAGILSARRRFYGWPSIVRRAFQPRTNLRTPRNFALYLLANKTSRREIENKQGRPLGGELHAAHAGQT